MCHIFWFVIQPIIYQYHLEFLFLTTFHIYRRFPKLFFLLRFPHTPEKSHRKWRGEGEGFSSPLPVAHLLVLPSLSVTIVTEAITYIRHDRVTDKHFYAT